MKARYSIFLGPGEVAQVNCKYWRGRPAPGTTYYIESLEVPANRRRQGYGTALMEQVLEDADREGVTLVLEVDPYGTMERQALYDWYGRLGFVPTHGKGMERKPAA